MREPRKSLIEFEPYSWFSLTWWDGHVGAQNNGKMSLKFCIIIKSNSQKYFFRYCSVHQHGRRGVKWKPRILAFESYQKNFQNISLLNDNLIPRPAIKCCDWNFWNLPSFISMSWLHLFRRFACGQVLDPPRPMAIGNASNLLCLIDFRQIITHGLKSSHPGNTSNSLIHEPECQWPRRLKKKKGKIISA